VKTRLLFAAIAAWGLAASTAFAASPELKIPDFEGLRGRATDSASPAGQRRSLALGSICSLSWPLRGCVTQR